MYKEKRKKREIISKEKHGITFFRLAEKLWLFSRGDVYNEPLSSRTIVGFCFPSLLLLLLFITIIGIYECLVCVCVFMH